MSATSMRLEWSVVIADSDRWTKAHVDTCHADTTSSSYEDWVVDQLCAVMAKAGQAFIEQHLDLFQHQELF